MLSPRFSFRILLSCFFAYGLTATNTAWAQKPTDRFLAEYTYTSPSEGELEDDLEIHEGKAGLLLPLSHSHNGGIGFSVGGYFQTDVWMLDDSDVDDLELYKIKAPVFVDFKITDDFSVLFNVTPGIHSDLEDVDEDDVRIDGALAFTWASSDKLAFVFGAAIGEEFGEAQAYPIGGVRWQMSERLLFDLVLPYPRVQFGITDGINLFAFGEPSGGEWNVGEGRTQTDIQQKGIRFGVGAELGIGENGWLYTALGVEVERELQLALNDNEVFDDEVELDDQNFVRVGFRIAMPRE